MTADPAPIDLRRWVRDVPDFPKPGILFRDLTPLMRDPQGWQETLRRLGRICDELRPELIVGIESRGFIVGAALAAVQGLGFVPVRKPGKLPGAVTGVDYDLEYGSDRLEIHSDCLTRVTTSASVINEGDQLITTVRTTELPPGSPLTFELSGEGITAADLSSGPLLGEGILDADGQLRLVHTIASDECSEGPETLEIRIFRDAERTIQLGPTARVRINDTSQGPSYGGSRVLIVDDLLATGGTAAACAELVRLAGGELCGFAFVVELSDLPGRSRLPAGLPVHALIAY